jgi:hypothetical protein
MHFLSERNYAAQTWSIIGNKWPRQQFAPTHWRILPIRLEPSPAAKTAWFNTSKPPISLFHVMVITNRANMVHNQLIACQRFIIAFLINCIFTAESALSENRSYTYPPYILHWLWGFYERLSNTGEMWKVCLW